MIHIRYVHSDRSVCAQMCQPSEEPFERVIQTEMKHLMWKSPFHSITSWVSKFQWLFHVDHVSTWKYVNVRELWRPVDLSMFPLCEWGSVVCAHCGAFLLNGCCEPDAGIPLAAAGPFSSIQHQRESLETGAENAKSVQNTRIPVWHSPQKKKKELCRWIQRWLQGSLYRW